MDGSGTDDGLPPTAELPSDRAARSVPPRATAQVGGTDAARSEGAAGRQRASQGKSARLTQGIARGVAGVDRHQGWAARGAADDQGVLNDVIGREIAAGVDLSVARAVDVADDLIRAGDDDAGGGAVVHDMHAIRAVPAPKPSRPVRASLR